MSKKKLTIKIESEDSAILETLMGYLRVNIYVLYKAYKDAIDKGVLAIHMKEEWVE